jgi:uroporphyrinogen-III synthase
MALRVVSLESRQSDDMARLLTRHGMSPIAVPSMQEVALADQTEVFAFGDALLAGGVDVLVLLTGVGTRLMVDTLCTRHAREQVVEALRATKLACRGPKSVGALKSMGLAATLTAPEPNTTQELIAEIDVQLKLSGQRVFIQEYGEPNVALVEALTARGATVRSVPVYGWSPSADDGPMQIAIGLLCGDSADVALFTSQKQVDYLLSSAERSGQKESLLAALNDRILVASVGPTTSDKLRRNGIAVDVEPEHPKMGHLALALGRTGEALLNAKRSRAAAM